MQQLQGTAFIAGKAVNGTATFQAINPATEQPLPIHYPELGALEVDIAAQAAQHAFTSYGQLSAAKRAEFLSCIAEQLELRREAIVATACAESALPEARINGELGRTTGQLQHFAKLLTEGLTPAPVIDLANPERQPVPKPDLRMIQRAIGPVAVFGASNFPLAFSVAGGDTASALAAGCPVVVKGHPAHPGTSELAAHAINAAIEICHLNAGVFSLLTGTSHQLGGALVEHPAIKGVGFTGSLNAGRALFNLAQQRPEPIPFYGELGSSNPVFLLPEALKDNHQALANGFTQSLNLGCGQFCTNPGLLLAIESEALDKFIASASEQINNAGHQVMLTAGIAQSFRKGCGSLDENQQCELLAKGAAAETSSQAQSQLYSVSAEDWLANPLLEEEVFGPCALLVRCKNEQQLIEISQKLSGHLTSTIHGKQADNQMMQQLMSILPNKVGRILFAGWPTGVDIAHAMVHGGPYPASTDSSTTSVGSTAFNRWVRPVSYQDCPDELLPVELQNSNPLAISRLVDGQLSHQAI